MLKEKCMKKIVSFYDSRARLCTFAQTNFYRMAYSLDHCQGVVDFPPIVAI